MIVVTGATGKLGRHVIEGLLQKVPASQIVAAVRDPEKANDFAKRGVQVRHADYSKPETLASAFKGAEKVLLISSNTVGSRAEHHFAVVEAAKGAGVKLLAYTSILHADTSPMQLAADHKATEERIKASGIPYVFLRNGWYIENYSENFGSALQHGAILGSAKEGRIAAATRKDFADAAVAVLTTPGQESKVYELAGDHPFTLNELAAELSKQSGKPVAYKDMPPEQLAGVLASFGLPQGFANILADSDVQASKGVLEDGSGDLRRLIGRPTTPLKDAIAVALKQ